MRRPTRTPALILAAGASSRLGSPKQLAVLQGETLLDRAVRVAQAAACSPVVVLGYRAAEIVSQCHLAEVEVVLNPEWQSGMASSLRVGAEWLLRVDPEPDGLLVLTCDQPALTAEHLRGLVAEGRRQRAAVASAYAGRCGVPAWLPKTMLPALLRLRGDVGARALLHGAATLLLPWGELDIDTPAALARAQELFNT